MHALSRYFASKPPADLINELPNYYTREQPVEGLANAINILTRYLPPATLIGSGTTGKTWGKYLDTAMEQAGQDKALYEQLSLIAAALSALPAQLKSDIRGILIPLAIPASLRTQHMHIIAGSGAGKSQLIQSMILDDLETDASIVVIDSQGDLINTIATRVPEERLILIDPLTCPPALNLFANQASNEQDIATAVELYEYIFSALDAGMTSKQSTAYRFVSRLLLTIQGANIHTMRELLEPGGTEVHKAAIERLNPTARSFFKNEFDGRDFKDTRSQILRRLYTVLENQTFERMLGAGTNKLKMGEALDSGKVILISTAKSLLKQTGSSLFGRIFLAQVMQSVMSRPPGQRRRTYLYIDEAQDYAEDSHVLFNLFEQARKYELGIIWAHQYLGQLPAQLTQSISANTAIKFASGVSSSDATVLAKQMRTTPEGITAQKQGTFAASFKDIGTVGYKVEFGRMERLRQVDNLATIQERMRQKYGAPLLIGYTRTSPAAEPTRPSSNPPTLKKPKDKFNPEE